jgi:endonuclease G
MQRSLLIGFFALALASASAAGARCRVTAPTGESPPTRCNSFYHSGQAPAAVAATVPSTRIFCHMIYSVGYSGALLNPLWSAEHLTRAMAVCGDNINRLDKSFTQQPELRGTNLTVRDRDYQRGFDRGHMTPANDAPDDPSQADTFVFSNAVPQRGLFNRGLWSDLEAWVHRLAEAEGEVFIVTGPEFGPHPPLMTPRPGQGRVPIPDSTFKAIFVPSLNLAVAFTSTNADASLCRIVTVAEITRRTGIDPFPALPAALKSQLPTTSLPQVSGARFPDCH